MINRWQSLIVSLAALTATTTSAAEYPAKPVRIVVGLAAGGPTDVVVRIFAAKVSENWPQPMVVENRVGAGATIAADAVAKSSPDGYSLLNCNVATHGISPSLYKNLPYDPIKDFAPISLIGTTPNILVVNPSVPAKSVSEFIALAKAS